MNDWVRRKLALAERLIAGDCGGGYDDAYLVLSAVMSAVAAALWPKARGTDRKRFVELWARYADRQLWPNLVSLPLLIQDLREKGQADRAESGRLLRGRYLDAIPAFDDLIVTGGHVDVREDAAMAGTKCTLSEVREYSYPNLFYRYFRSGYVHEYQTGFLGDPINMSGLDAPVSYESWMEPPHRRICFNVRWVLEIVRTTCSGVEQDWESRPLPIPSAWWIDGAQ